MKSQGKKVFVGVSGGVDSSVALALLQKDGFDVTGVFLKVWHPDFLPCDWKEERRSAMRVCATLGVPFITLDCEAEYKKEVVDYMLREYSLGRIPNPDVFCNKYVKFGVFLKKALEMGAAYVATGHYAMRCEHAKNINEYELRESADKNKDQSYFLYTLNQDQLKHVLFPVGGMTKPQVRKLAEKYNLPTAYKKDSQGLCFIGKVDMKDFLSHYVESQKGDVLDVDGNIIGTHDGALFYAIGQRHGFTVLKKSADDGRYFVVSKDMEKNTITVSHDEDEIQMLSTREIVIHDLHFISGIEPAFPLTVSVRIRYRQEKQKCTITKKSDGHHVVFIEPQTGVSIGQSAVFYDGAVCLGGGVIEKVL